MVVSCALVYFCKELITECFRKVDFTTVITVSCMCSMRMESLTGVWRARLSEWSILTVTFKFSPKAIFL